MDGFIYWLDSLQLPAFFHAPWMFAAFIVFAVAFNAAVFVVTARWSSKYDAQSKRNRDAAAPDRLVLPRMHPSL
jgi:hypothetical protein